MASHSAANRSKSSTVIGLSPVLSASGQTRNVKCGSGQFRISWNSDFFASQQDQASNFGAVLGPYECPFRTISASELASYVARSQTVGRNDELVNMSYTGSATDCPAVAAGSPRGVEHLSALTPLRGIAALWVAVFHFGLRFPNVHPDHYGIVREGYLAVDMFFVLSGFVISHVYKDIFARKCTERDYWDFLKARIARIYPLHFIMLMVFLAAVALQSAVICLAGGGIGPVPLTGDRSVAGLFANLAMLQGLWAGGLSWNNPAWSISVEFIAYLLFPLLFPWLWRARPRGKAIAGLVAFVALAGLAWYTGDDLDQWNGLPAILRCLSEFLVGVLVYSIYYQGLFTRLFASDLALGLVVVLLCVLVQHATSDFGVVLLFPLLILTAVRNEGRLRHLLNVAPLRWLGDVSYSLYLVHWFVLFALLQSVPRLSGVNPGQFAPATSLLAALLLIAVSIALAAVTYRLIEVRGRQWLRRRLAVTRFATGAGLLRVIFKEREAANAIDTRSATARSGQ
jgi:peptidoglycan/LPS O-acetylase OafA/YrhL